MLIKPEIKKSPENCFGCWLLCLVFETLGQVFQWNNHAWSDAINAVSDEFWANEQLLKGGKIYGPIVLNNNNNNNNNNNQWMQSLIDDIGSYDLFFSKYFLPLPSPFLFLIQRPKSKFYFRPRWLSLSPSLNPNQGSNSEPIKAIWSCLKFFLYIYF